MTYTPPTVADFKAKFPGLASVEDAVISGALTEASARVDETWRAEDFAPARLYLAAHILTLDGHGTQAQIGGLKASGVKSIKSGTMSAEFTDGAAGGDASLYASTSYGARFKALLDINHGGPLSARSAAGEFSHLAQDRVVPWGFE